MDIESLELQVDTELLSLKELQATFILNGESKAQIGEFSISYDEITNTT